jgi:hypothetical protein
MTGHRAARRAQSSRKFKGNRLGYRVGEWAEMTGTSRVTTWRKIKNKTLRTIDYDGITLIPHSEAVRLQLADA